MGQSNFSNSKLCSQRWQPFHRSKTNIFSVFPHQEEFDIKSVPRWEMETPLNEESTVTSPTIPADVEGPPLPQALILGPGGVKGFIELGALLTLEEQGFLNDVQTIVGVSVGAIIGLLLCAGYSVNEVIMMALKAELFHDLGSCGFVATAQAIRENKGLMSNTAVRRELEHHIRKKFGMIPTLRGLHLVTGIKFVVTTLNLTKKQTEYLSYENEPTLSCVDAVLLSINIPFVFYQLRYRGNLYIDGAFGDPYPMNLFAHDYGTEMRVLGLYIPSCWDVGGRRSGGSENDPLTYLFSVVQSMIDINRRRILQGSGQQHYHLELHDTAGKSQSDPIGWSLDESDKKEMIAMGYRQGSLFLDRICGRLSQESLRAFEELDQEGDVGRPATVIIETDDPIPLLSTFLSEHPELQGATGALLAMARAKSNYQPTEKS